MTTFDALSATHEIETAAAATDSSISPNHVNATPTTIGAAATFFLTGRENQSHPSSSAERSGAGFIHARRDVQISLVTLFIPAGKIRSHPPSGAGFINARRDVQISLVTRLPPVGLNQSHPPSGAERGL